MESSDHDSNLNHASTVLYNPDLPPLYDIIFVHGLCGHPVRSWRHKNKCVWPRDVLPTTDGFGSSRIITLGYNSKIAGSGATSQNVYDHARGMLADIRRYRSGVTGRPILFVAHDIGGNILKEVLITSFRENVPQGENIARNTIAIVFFATPQRGAEILNDIYGGMQVVRFLGLRTARKLVKQVRPGTDYLYEASIKFNEVLKAVQIHIFSFYATLPVPFGFRRTNSPSREEVLIGNPNEQCLSLEGTPFDIQRISGRQDPNYARVLGCILPLMQPPFLPHPPKSAIGSAKSLPGEKPSDAELERIRALELGLLRVVVTKWSWNSERGNIDVPVAALIDGKSDENVISHAFVAENLPHLHKNADWITLTFKPASGGGAQSRHFKAFNISHPMVLGAGGLYSRRGPAEAIEGKPYSGTDPILSPAEEGYLPTITQNTDSRKVILVPHVDPAISNQKGKSSLSGATITVSHPAALSQGDPISSIQTLPKATSSGIPASIGKLARSVTEAANSSSEWPPSTGISLGAASASAVSGAAAMYGVSVARGAKAQAVRSADIAERNLKLNEDVFKYNKKKDKKAKKQRQGASAAAVKNAAAMTGSSQSGSTSDDTDSSVGGSSSKSTSNPVDRSKRSALRSPPTRTPNRSSAPPDRLHFPAVPTHGFDTRPGAPEQKPLQEADGMNIEMLELSSPNDADLSIYSVERSQPEHPAYSYGSSPAQAPSPPSAEDAQGRKDESQQTTTIHDNSVMIQALPLNQKYGGHAEAQSGARPVGNVDDIGDSGDHLGLQQDSTSSPDKEQAQEVEPVLAPRNEALPVEQQFEDQLICISLSSIVEKPMQRSESIPDFAVQAMAEEQCEPGTATHGYSTGEIDGKTHSSADPEGAESGKEQLPISVSDKDSSDENAKEEQHDLEVEDSTIEESQSKRSDSAENEVKENEVEDEQIKDIGIEADPKDEEGPKIKALGGEPEACSPRPHEVVGRVSTSVGNIGDCPDAVIE